MTNYFFTDYHESQLFKLNLNNLQHNNNWLTMTTVFFSLTFQTTIQHAPKFHSNLRFICMVTEHTTSK